MKKLSEFDNKEIPNNKLQKIVAGKNISTWIGGTEENPTYTDVHADNDDDGIWSQGDTFTLTKK